MGEEQPGQQHVTNFLTAMGFQVSPIRQISGDRHADLIADKDGMRTVLEVKSRLDDPIFNSLAPKVESGKVQEYSAPTGKTGTFSRRVKKAASQLEGSARSNDFRCLWFVIDPHQLVEVDDQIIGTLLGRRYILGGKEPDESGAVVSESCYALGRADFQRCPEIDCAIIDQMEKALFIANIHSPRYSKLAKWPLRKIFPSESVKDILVEEKAGKAYIVPLDTPISCDDDILEYVKEKYGRSGPLFLFDPVTHGAVTRIKDR
jgi:hypothetical protein